MAIRVDTALPAALPARGRAKWRWVLPMYAGYLALFTLLAAWTSSAFPKFVEEAQVPVWPPAEPLTTWLERVVLLPVYRYDVIWYIGIARDGYGVERGDTVFHPLFPLLVGLFGRALGGQYLLAAWLVAQVCCAAMLALLYELVLMDEDEATARRAVLFLIGSPLGFTLLLPYTDSLLMLGVVGALYAGRRGRWWLAGMAGAAAALAKQPGALVLLPLLWELWLERGPAARSGRPCALLTPLAALSLVPLALLCWIVYRAGVDGAVLPWSEPFAFVNRVLLAPSYEGVWDHTLDWPWVAFGMALRQLNERPSFYLLVNVVLVSLMTVLTLYAALRTRRSYAVYSLAVLVLRLSIVYPLLPLMAAARHLTLIFPIFVQLGRWARRPSMALLILLVNTLFWTLLTTMYVRNAFVP
jgi:hypothetical protein